MAKRTSQSTPDNDRFPQKMGGYIRRSKESKVRVLRQWGQALLFLEGLQWIRYDDQRAGFDIVDPPEGRERITVNLLLNPYRNLAARLEVEMPGVTATPATDAADDLTKAKSAELLVQYQWQREHVSDVYDSLIEWVMTCGTAGRYDWYDKETKRVRTSAVSPFDLFFEDGAVDEFESAWIARRRWFARSALKKLFPKKKEEIETATQSDTDDSVVVDRRTRSPLTGDAGERRTPTERSQDDRLEVFEVYWHDGRRAVLLNDVYLEKEGDTGLSAIPIQIIRYTRIPGAIWGLGMIKPAINLQYLYNLTRSMIIENIDKMGNPVWLRPIGSDTPASAFNNSAGNVISFNPAMPMPQQAKPVELPQHVMQHPAQLAAEMQDTIGVHSTTSGKRAAGITAGRAIDSLTQNDVTQLDTTKRSFFRATWRGTQTVLELYKKHWTKKQSIAMLDQFGSAIFEELNATDIPTEIHLHASSLFKFDAELRDGKVFAELQAGLLLPEDAIKRLSTRALNSDAFRKVTQLRHAQSILDKLKAADSIMDRLATDIRHVLENAQAMFQVPRAFRDVFAAYQAGAIQLDDAVLDIMDREDGPGIKVFVQPTDDPTILLEVFGDFIRSEDYEKLSLFSQDLIADLYDQAVMARELERAQQPRLFDQQGQQPQLPGPSAGAPVGQASPTNPGQGALADGTTPAAEALGGLGGGF